MISLVHGKSIGWRVCFFFAALLLRPEDVLFFAVLRVADVLRVDFTACEAEVFLVEDFRCPLVFLVVGLRFVEAIPSPLRRYSISDQGNDSHDQTVYGKVFEFLVPYDLKHPFDRNITYDSCHDHTNDIAECIRT